MDNEAKRIAEGLTEAQRRSVMLARPNSLGRLVCPTYRDMGQMLRSLANAGICNKRGLYSKLGTRVRTYLEQKQ